MKRRQFIQAAGAMTAAAQTSSLLARDPIVRTGPPRFQIGLAAYSLRNYFSFMKGKQRPPADDGPAIDMVGFMDYCVAQNFDAAELTSYFFDPSADDAYFLNLKREAYLRGLAISGTAIGNNFTVGLGPRLDQEVADAMAWIDRAALLGAPHIRFFAGTGSQLASAPERIVEASDALNRCAEHAAKRGVFLGVENHGNLTSDQMLELMRRADSPWVGINLDTGNFVSDDPYGDLEKCVPYAVNVQVKISMRSPDGKHYPADMNRIAKILKDGGYQGYVILEYEDANAYDKIPAAHEALRSALAAN
ncbi:sugar phosphate isomerase/epimerase family protein [Rubripirellula lacrimiformis]|nr:sugar phosphate isomerase/epimerase family protein [Rubripirellula lacrimiformis]